MVRYVVTMHLALGPHFALRGRVLYFLVQGQSQTLPPRRFVTFPGGWEVGSGSGK